GATWWGIPGLPPGLVVLGSLEAPWSRPGNSTRRLCGSVRASASRAGLRKGSPLLPPRMRTSAVTVRNGPEPPVDSYIASSLNATSFRDTDPAGGVSRGREGRHEARRHHA